MTKKYQWLLIAFLLVITGGLYLAFRYDRANLATWFGSIVTVGTLVVAYVQLYNQRRDFESSQIANLKIAINERNISKHKDGIEYVSVDKEFVFWATNIGLVAGMFKFIGFCSEEKFEEIQNADSETREDLLENAIIDPAPEYSLGIEHRVFEKIEPKSISSEIKIPEKMVLNQFPGEKYIYVFYMDPVGELYERKMQINSNGG